MSRSLSYLRRGLLGIAFVGSLGFGATQVLASSPVSRHSDSCTIDEARDCREFCSRRGKSGTCTVDPQVGVLCMCG